MILKQWPETPKMVKKKDTKIGKTVTHNNKGKCKYSKNRDVGSSSIHEMTGFKS